MIYLRPGIYHKLGVNSEVLDQRDIEIANRLSKDGIKIVCCVEDIQCGLQRCGLAIDCFDCPFWK